MIMKCQNCGHEVTPGDNYCENCGAKIEMELRRSHQKVNKIDTKIVIIVIIAIMIVVGGAFFIYEFFVVDDKPVYTGEDTVGITRDDNTNVQLEIDPTKMEIQVGESQKIDCNQDDATFRSSDTKIATVSNSGSVKGVSAGTAKITVSYKNKEVICQVTVKETTSTDSSQDYIFPNSATQLLTEADLQGKTVQELRIGRNEIYARHGRKFNDATLQSYFDSKSWYHGTIEADDFNEDTLTEIEKQNADFIRSHESQ